MSVPRNDTSQWHRESLELSALYAVELRGLLIWKLGVLSLFGGAIVFALAFLGGVDSRLFGAGWFAIAVLQVLLTGMLSQSMRELQIWRWAFVTAVSALAWWVLAEVCGIISPSLSPVVPALVLLILGMIPWPFRGTLALMFVFLLLALLASLISPSPVVLLVLVLAAAPVMMRSASINHLYQISRICSGLVVRCFESNPPARDLVRHLARECCRVVDSERALIIFGDGEVEIIKGMNLEGSAVERLYALGLAERIEQAEGGEGLISLEDLGEQFLAPAMDWFASLPWALFYVSFPAISDGKEERIKLIIPLRDYIRLAGIHRTLSSLVELAAVVRIALSAQRSRHLSADVLAATQQSASEQEQDLNQIIHHVNNSAQDLTIICEELRKTAGSLPQEANIADLKAELIAQAQRLEGSSRNLSSEVSDVKLLHELLGRRDNHRLVETDIGELLEGLSAYGMQRAYRKGFDFSTQNDVPAGVCAQTGSREFLETCLRLLIRLAGSRVGKDGRVKLASRYESGHVLIEISDNGRALDQLVRDTLLHTVPLEKIKGSALKYLWAAGEFLRARGGHITFLNPEGEAANRMLVSLTAIEKSLAPVLEKGGWILLVDDNPEVTVFYARIADALSLTHYTAESCEQALKIVEERGRPRLVISDLQLGNSSGLTLLQTLRARFGEKLPVIVVSGNSDEKLMEETRAAGATRYMTKPVGRRKLFAEIREILAS